MNILGIRPIVHNGFRRSHAGTRQTVIGKRAGGEIMSEDKEQKIEVNLEELRYWKVKDYDEALCITACIR